MAESWSSDGIQASLLNHDCNIDRVPVKWLSQAIFDSVYRDHLPVILEGLDNSNMQLRTGKGELLRTYGNITVTLSTANTFSHEKVPMSFGQYITGLQPRDVSQLGNETLYLFGPESELGTALAPLINLYRPPPFAGADKTSSFGLGASGSGVPFHVHGPGFSEVFHGQKRWLLYPPHHRPPFDPEASSMTWLQDVYPTLQGPDQELLLDCTIAPGEALYFPSMWWHAVVNIGESVFMSTFTNGPMADT